MSKIEITFLETEKWEEKYLRDKLGKIKNSSLVFFPKPLNKSILEKIKNTEILAVFIYSKIDKSVLDKMPKLKFIATMSTGFDHIDVKECKRRGIKVGNVPFYGENTVAEHTFALILALTRKIPDSIERVKQYDFSLDGLMGSDLAGKTLGIVGLGHIGQHVARMAKAFEMKIIASDARKDLNIAKKIGLKYVSLNYLLANSDVITLHAPYNESTKHLINKNNIKLIKKGAYLVNTARGGLIETGALVSALNKKIIAGAGLDVLEEECFIREEKELLSRSFQDNCDLTTMLQDHFLIRDERVLVTPHNAFNSKEALQRILDTTLKNIKGELSGKSINTVK